MKKTEYFATYKENKLLGSRKVKLSLGDYNNWDEVLEADNLWGSVNFNYGDTMTLIKSEKFPTDIQETTFFDERLHWTYVRVLSITKKETITTSELIWKI